MTHESTLAASIMDRFEEPEIREYMRHAVELLADDFLAQGFGEGETEPDNVVALRPVHE